MTVSKELEQRLLSALDTVGAHVLSGDSPTQAVVKAAQEHQLRPGGVTKLVHAYNVARTTRQREDNDTVFDKAADFELADAATALETLYPDTVKTAADVSYETTVSPEYGLPPALVLGEFLSEKAAACVAPPPVVATPPKPRKPEPGPEVTKAFDIARNATKDTDEARRKMTAARDKLGAALGSLTHEFLRQTCPPYSVVRNNAEIVYGAAGGKILDMVLENAPHLTKLSQHRPTKQAEAAAKCEPVTHPVYGKIREFCDALYAYDMAKTNYTAVKQANDARAEAALAPFVVAAPSLLDESPLTIPSSIRSSSGSLLDDMPEKAAAGVPGSGMLSKTWQTLGSLALAKGMFEGVAKDLKGPDEGQIVKSTLNKLTDPEHEGKLRAINTQATMQDFMLNDPIISGYAPNEVMDAFNEVTQLAPSLSDQRLPLQAILRKRLQQGSLDPFDTEQVLKIEQGLRQRNLIPRPLGDLPGA